MEESTVPSVFDELDHEATVLYATPVERFVHYLVDSILLGGVNFGINYFMASIILSLPDYSFSFSLGSFSISIVSLGFSTIIRVMFFTVMEGATGGRSLGKLLTGSVAVSHDFRRLTWKDAVLRSLCRIIPFEPISGLFGSWWHDRLTRTHVVTKDSIRRY